MVSSQSALDGTDVEAENQTDGLAPGFAALLEAARSLSQGHSQAILAGIFASMPLGAAVLDSRNTVLASFGEPIHLLNGLTVNGTADSEHIAALIETARRLGRASGEGVYDGNVLNVTAIAVESGGIVLVAHDVTEQRRAAAELIQARTAAEMASRSKSIFLANMSHELRTPLNAIIGFADLMRQGYFGAIGNERYREYLGDIRDSGAHLLSLISDLLDISRIEAGQYRLQEEVVDLATEIAAAVRFLRELATKSGVMVETQMSTVPPIWAETRAMRQILINLIGNALKFTRAGGRIIVSAQMNDGCPVLSVRDTGIGMDEAMRRHLESGLGGYRADTKMEGQGTGLGLPIVRSLVAIHGGMVEIRSRPGEGTTVTVIFPPERAMPFNNSYGLRPWEIRDDEDPTDDGLEWIKLDRANLMAIAERNRRFWTGMGGGMRAKLAFHDLSAQVLDTFDLRGADLTGALLKDASLRNTKLTEAVLYAADLRMAILKGANLDKADLRGACLRGANLNEASLIEADMREGRVARRTQDGNLKVLDFHLAPTDFVTASLRGANLTRSKMAHSIATQVDLTDVNLSHAKLNGADLRNANLTGASLVGTDLTGTNLSGATLCGAVIIGAVMSKTVLAEANLLGAVLDANAQAAASMSGASNVPGEGPVFDGSVDDLVKGHEIWVKSLGKEGKRIDMTGVNMKGVELPRADLSGAILASCCLEGAKLAGARLTLADLSLSDLRRADMEDADLRGITLRRAYLADANLDRANCRAVRFGNQATQVMVTQFERARMWNASLRGAALNKAMLVGVDFQGADLTGASLQDTDCRDANFTGAKLAKTNLDQAILIGVRGLSRAE